MKPKSATTEILVIRRLLSKDMFLSIRLEEVRLTLEHNSEWLRLIAKSTRIIRSTFSVMVYEVKRKVIKISDIKQTITDIYKENDRLHTNLDFVHFS